MPSFGSVVQFTPREAKLLERYRKQEESWPRTRWLFVTAAGFSFAVAGFIVYSLLKMLNDNTLQNADKALMCAVFWPNCLLHLLFGFVLAATAIRDWHGNIRRMLLLRLLDSQIKKAD